MTARGRSASVGRVCYEAPVRRRSLSVPEQEGLRLGSWLPGALGVSADEAAALIRAGAVYVQGRRATEPARPLPPGAKVSVVLEERGVSPLIAASAPALRVLFEDEDVLAVDKPAGVVAQPTASRVGGSLLDLVSAHLGRTAGLVHRLDRETSGVTVFGKNAAATAALAEQFRAGRARKRYLAVTGPGLPPRGRLDLPLSADPSHKGRFRASRTANGKEALTDFERLFGDDVFSIVLALPKTGRTHQIRAHLAGAGFPIAGDALYRGALTLGGEAVPRCLLHARTLVLTHPRSLAPLCFDAPVPDDLRRWFDRARMEPPGEGPAT